MPVPSSPLRKLGFDSAWVRHRHLQYGISSPVAALAAATQRTAEDFGYQRVRRLRTPRTATPQGPARLMFAPDLVGTAAALGWRPTAG